MQVQLAKKVDDKFKGFNNPYYSRKFDGKRMYILDGKGYSRTNKLCYQEPIKHIINEINEVDLWQQYVFDGELLYFDEDGIEDFSKGISLSNSKDYKDECRNLVYVIFDINSRRFFINQEAYDPFAEEYRVLREVFNCKYIGRPDLYATEYPHIFIAKQYNNPDALRSYKDFDRWEGLMVRDGYAPYQFKRTGNLRKIKKFQDGEFEIIDYYSGTGKYEDMLGGIVIDYKGNRVCVGSGFTDEQREEYLNGHEVDWLIGRKAKVKYFQESCDDKGKPSLRFPIFQCLRDDDMEEY